MKNASLTLGIITYKRAGLLRDSLNSIEKIIIPQNMFVNVLVVDNDIDESAKNLVNSVKDHFPLDISYVVEKEKGIPVARNKVLELCINKDYIAFIDDDDTADEYWLLELYSSMLKYKADVVKGYVNYQFNEENKCLRKLGLFSNPQNKTGEELNSAWTNNVLFSTDVYKKNDLKFDKSFTKTGGSDSYFFNLVKKNEFKIVMCREAIVNSPVGEDRSTVMWLFKRSFRIGANITIIDKKMLGRKASLKNLKDNFMPDLKYFFNLMKSSIKYKESFLIPFSHLSFVIGRVSGIFGYSTKEYK